MIELQEFDMQQTNAVINFSFLLREKLETCFNKPRSFENENVTKILFRPPFPQRFLRYSYVMQGIRLRFRSYERCFHSVLKT